MAKNAKNVVEYRIYDLPLNFPVMLLHGREWCISDILSNRLHFHNCFEIGICHSDSGILVFEDQKIPFRAGDVSCIPRHVPHTTCSDKGSRSRWSYLFIDLEQILGRDGFMLSSSGQNLVACPDYHWLLHRNQHPKIHFIVSSIVDEILENKSNYETVVRHLLILLYHELIRLQNAASDNDVDKNKNSFILKPALEHILRHYMQPITVDSLAEMCRLSTTHFRRLFVSVVGEAPISFLNTVRINQACILLQTTDDSILSIAEAVGFTTISSFNRYFSKLTGVSPREYRDPSIRDNLQPRRKHVLRQMGWMKPELRPESAVEDDHFIIDHSINTRKT